MITLDKTVTLLLLGDSPLATLLKQAAICQGHARIEGGLQPTASRRLRPSAQQPLSDSLLPQPWEIRSTPLPGQDCGETPTLSPGRGRHTLRDPIGKGTTR